MLRRQLRVRFMKAANLAIRSAMPSEPHSTIPSLIVACVVGDGEAETGPLATAWQSNKFLDPISDGAVLPILHLNGFKISNPTLLLESSMRSWSSFFAAAVGRRYFRGRHRSGKDAPTHGRYLDEAIEDNPARSNAMLGTTTTRLVRDGP
jgi:xylulose-5-phosphate/fructose-6-phosphate phosphoketolase